MTGPCPGAQVGVAKPGFAALQYISPGAIGGALASLAGWEGAAVGAAIGALTYELTTFCPGGPPAPPTFTVGDITALLGGPAQSGYNAAVVKMRDFLGGVFWPLLCDCSAGGTPTIAAPSTYPSGAPQSHTVSIAGNACDDSGTHTVVTGSGNFALITALAGVYLRITLVNTIVSGAGQALRVGLSQFYVPPGGSVSSGFNMGTTNIDVPQGLTTVQILPVQIGARAFRPDFVAITPNGTSTVTCRMELFCTSTPPGGTQSPCCPPDPATQNALDELLRMVTLIQRQLAPFGYVLGATHAGLTGAGTIDISGLLGAKIDPTTIPGSYGRQGTTPEEFFELGWVTFGSPDGYPSSYRVEHDPQLLLPARCSAYTTLAYDLAPGVELTITEVSREP